MIVKIISDEKYTERLSPLLDSLQRLTLSSLILAAITIIDILYGDKLQYKFSSLEVPWNKASIFIIIFHTGLIYQYFRILRTINIIFTHQLLTRKILSLYLNHIIGYSTLSLFSQKTKKSLKKIEVHYFAQFQPYFCYLHGYWDRF